MCPSPVEMNPKRRFHQLHDSAEHDSPNRVSTKTRENKKRYSYPSGDVSFAGVRPLSCEAKVGELRIELFIEQHISSLEISKDDLQQKTRRPVHNQQSGLIFSIKTLANEVTALSVGGISTHPLLIVQVRKPSRRPECNLHSNLPWQHRRHGAEDMVVEALVRHVPVYQQPLNPPLVVVSAVADELHEVGVIHHAQKMHFRHPLIMTLEYHHAQQPLVHNFTLSRPHSERKRCNHKCNYLKAGGVELLDGDLELLLAVVKLRLLLDGALVHMPEAAFANEILEVEALGRGFELLESESSQVVRLSVRCVGGFVRDGICETRMRDRHRLRFRNRVDEIGSPTVHLRVGLDPRFAKP